MEENSTYDVRPEALDARSAALTALEHESANLREAAEMRAKTALDLKAASDAQVKVASTVNLINSSLTGAFRALEELRARILAYKDETAQAADDLLAEAAEIEAGLKANQEETFEAVTQVLGSALAEISDVAAGEPAEARPEPAQAPAAHEMDDSERQADDEPAHEEGEAQGRAERDASVVESINERVPTVDDIGELDEPDDPAASTTRSQLALKDATIAALLAARDESERKCEAALSVADRLGEENAELSAQVESLLRERAAQEKAAADEGQEISSPAGEPGAREQEPADEPPADLGESPTEEEPATAELTPTDERAEKAEPRPRPLTRSKGFGADASTRCEAVNAAYGRVLTPVEPEQDGPEREPEPDETEAREAEEQKGFRGYL